ncbi:hypothetical protein [Breoghania sp.]|uniref:hypothetical protein n=1 Tax=Breoghania sp. TaxID=2065378 RepID=UPI002609B3DA|nr:hypothetical protein [Breoghania sp.]
MTSDESDRVRISIIPYSEGVRLQESYALLATDDYSSKCTTERTGDEQYTDASYETEPIGNGSNVDYDDLPDGYSQSAGNCPSSYLVPLTNNKSTLLTAINNLSTNGSTAGQTDIA